ncbi:dipeptidase PepE [Antarcticibacterium arcticum]|uniref:Dipeptidase PepE n=1 Tax=Antarcticibacterium arcticum TaxID=2585771 RepID=A0A5B8YEE0_9FLAO|nr:dipeptidase PepE [Antarcticibacterium arcticum]QED36260.1 dipeptidase PepE [Antarcticibacterium arcticum]
MKNAILASTSTLHGQTYLEYLLPEIQELFKERELLFIPYARPGGISHTDYTDLVKKSLENTGIAVKGLHEYEDPAQAVQESKGIFTGGGNTFLLVEKLYRNNIMGLLRQVILQGTPYLGTSAGTNIAGLTMQTTNDMPIIYPPSFQTLGVVPFNINPHYLDPVLNSTHKGETRETRIREFHTLNTQPVIGLREGSWLELKGGNITLRGNLTARIFKVNETPFEAEPSSNLNDLK